MDLIDRQAAIDAIRNATFSFTVKSDIDFANYRKVIQEIFDNVLDAQEKALNELPSAQPQSTMGQVNETAPSTNDCISRQAAIDAAKDWYEGLICGSFRGLEKRLKSLPSAQPGRKKGRIVNPTPYGECSECGYLIDSREGYNFCPNCGADIRGEQNETDRCGFIRT